MNLVLATFLIASVAIMLTWVLQKVTTPAPPPFSHLLHFSTHPA